MLNGFFFTTVILYLVATVTEFAGMVFKKGKLKKAAWILLLACVGCHTVYLLVRGLLAHRVPLANQFEFACAFAWGVSVMGIFFKIRARGGMEWITTLCTPMAFLILSYAALQPQEITELMPALRSAWFVLHIGTAVFSYAAFALAACTGIRYLLMEKRNQTEDHLRVLDTLSYKLVSFGFLMLSVVILSGCIWAEQAWSSFWTWDPKEVWALITWIVYAVFLHQRIRANWRGHRMAVFSIIAFVFVIFTFAGVNKLMSGLHSYA